MNLQEVDLDRTIYPNNTTIEIEGLGKIKMSKVGGESLFSGIANALCLLTGEIVVGDQYFLRKITLLELDQEKNFVKVRIAKN